MSAAPSQTPHQGSQSQPQLPPAKSSDIASAVLKQWTSDTRQQVGYRRGESVSPQKAQVTLEVSSFLQVPAILKAIETGESIRLKFPEAAPGTKDADKIRAEQKEIREFIKQQSAGKLSDIAGVLAEKLKTSAHFGELAKGKFTAEEWIAAHGLNQKANARTLTVTSIYDANVAVKGLQEKLQGLMVKLEDHLARKDGTDAVVTVNPENAEKLAGEIANYLKERNGKAHGLANVTMWVGASKDPLDGTKISQEECAKLLTMSLDEFLRRYGKAGAATQGATTEKSTTAEARQTDAATEPKESAAKLSGLITLVDLQYTAVAV